MSKTAECPVCGAEVELADDAVQGELITCQIGNDFRRHPARR
ncbi:MAG: hypothetical protein P8X42_12045 [Calditrichaceae bacterium]